jgi:hypothetical protein
MALQLILETLDARFQILQLALILHEPFVRLVFSFPL